MDIDLLSEINEASKCVVQMTLTTYDDDLCKILEPHVCNTKRRIEVLEEMQKRGIPTVERCTIFGGSFKQTIPATLHHLSGAFLNL